MGLFGNKNKPVEGVNRALLDKDVAPVNNTVSLMKEDVVDDYDLTFDDEVVDDLDTGLDNNAEIHVNLNKQDLFESLAESTKKVDTNELEQSTVPKIQLSKDTDYEEDIIQEDTYENVEQSTTNNNSLPEDSERSTELKNYLLYIISDRTFPGMLSYFRYYGSKVTKVFSNLNDAKDVLLMQVEPCKIVIIDSGTGKLTSMTARKSLMDLLSISDDESRIAIFYTDSVIKSEAKNTEGVEDKDITWHKYKNMAGVLARLLQNLSKENYVYDIKEEEKVDKSDELLNFYGATCKVKESMDLGKPVLGLDEILAHMSSNITAEESLETYKVKV